MTRKLIFTSILAVAALNLAVGTAGAQDRQGHERRRESGSAAQAGRAQRREAPPQAAARASEPRQQAAAQGTSRGNANRAYSAPQAETRGYGAVPPSADRTTPRGYRGGQYGGGQYNGGQVEQRAVPRPYGGYASPAPRYDDHRGYAQPGGGYGRRDAHPYVVPRDFHPYRPFYFSRPYYGFRPHLHVEFGVWLGVSVPYPWAYFGAYRPRVYGYYDQSYYNQGYYGVAPGVQQYGGLSFDIQPYDAGLFVDGEYVGTVGTFTPYGEPLTLWPGVHHVAIVRDGYRTMEWDVTVEPGRVIPYRGMLSRW